ncbi:ribosomal RNA processing protein 1 homolog A-like [Macrosteles quadrilineatus]|uniref:ribosomal RNA processing protein 1 homolog A-like n=1 Tax=Macrosteles quadrilineatus TaxID=74068 RepID=UPI0023E152AD|nr:ribosomal RNA processing protein 1 homolog A-like [Macrosteles quadrilineatus]
MEEVHLTTIKPKNNVLLLAQEISFAKVLACNDKRLRDRGVRRLKKWFMARSQGSMDFTKDDFMRIWKGLFYCMWMSDKPLVQEDLAEEISKLIHSFANFKASLLFIETFFSSLSIEWFGIDQLRLDKYLMLVRRFIRQSLELVARSGWRDSEVKQLTHVYHQTLTSAPMGLNMHIIEVFCEELAKVGKGELSSSTILQFITVFAKVMANLKDGRMISQIMRYVFLHLIRQTELGIEHHMKEQAWKEYGFPGGDVDAAEKIEADSDEEVEEESEDGEEWEEEREVAQDARAGRVDVLLPPLDFDIRDLLEVLRELRNMKETTTKARKTLIQLIAKYENLAAGKYPLGIHKVDLPNKVDKKKEITQAAKRLLMEEEKRRREEDDDVETGLSKRKSKKLKVLKEKTSFWKVSESNESADNSLSETNTSWEVSESESKSTKTKKTQNKRKLKEESNGNSSEHMKKLKISQFSVTESKDNSIKSTETSTPKAKNVNLNNSEFSVSDCKIITPKSSEKKTLKKSTPKFTAKSPKTSTPKAENANLDNSQLLVNDCKIITPKTSKQKTPKTSTPHITTTSENITPHVEEIKTPLTRKDKNKTKRNKRLKNSSTDIPTEEIQSPEIDSTTNNSEMANGESRISAETSSLQLNTSTTDKNNGWGGEWEDKPQDVEYEIFIPNKKYVEKRKSLGLPFPVSSFVQKSAEKVTPVNKSKRIQQNQSATPGSQKKVEFNLSANRAQEYKEYAKKLKTAKNEIAFDASKKPVQGLLKNSTPSPINPFYKKKLNFLKKSPTSS